MVSTACGYCIAASAVGGILAAVLSVKMNDLAVRTVGVLSGVGSMEPPGGLSAGLREYAARGIVRRGEVVTWADSAADNAPSFFPDLTGWECSESSLHLEDFVPVDVVVDGRPCIGEDGQRILLLNGIALARVLGRLVYALDPPTPVRCVIGVNETNATFRFHRIRVGEHWNRPDLDGYRQDKMIVVDIEPADDI